MTNHQLSELIRKLKETIERRGVSYVEPINATEASFILELIEKNWKRS